MPRSEIFCCPPGHASDILCDIRSNGPPDGFRSLPSRRFSIDEHEILSDLLGAPGPDWGDADVDDTGTVLLKYPRNFVACLADMDPAVACAGVLSRTGFVPPTPPPGVDLAQLPPQLAASFAPDAGWGRFYEELAVLAAYAKTASQDMHQFISP